MRIKKTLMVLRLKFIVCALSFLATACLFPGRGVAAEQAAPAKLAVLVVFDQLRGDYLSRWDRLFGPDGFHRIEKEGVWFTNCHYPYAYTVTGAGHASLTTGTWPSEHGIIGNEWFDRATGDEAGCVAVGRYTRVPPKPGAEASRTSVTSLAKTSVSPERLLVPNVADALKDATGGNGKVVSLSFKDRSAVLPGGKRPDACYWFDTSAGIFVTSTYYREKPHAWVDAFNKSRIADKWFSMNWDRLRTDVDYESLSGPDDVIGEGRGQAQGRTFPHPMHGGDSKPGSRYNQALYNSPFGNELLCSLAAWAVDAENLGNGDAPDLLCLSFSCNDTIGHIWGDRKSVV